MSMDRHRVRPNAKVRLKTIDPAETGKFTDEGEAKDSLVASVERLADRFRRFRLRNHSADRTTDLHRDRRRVRRRREIARPCARVRLRVKLEVTRSEPCLADAARARDRHEPCVMHEQLVQALEIVASAYEHPLTISPVALSGRSLGGAM